MKEDHLKIIYLFICIASCVEQFQLSTISIETTNVGETTTLEFQLQISRTSDQRVENGDYLILDIPRDSSATWDYGSEPTCEIFNKGSALECFIMSHKQAQITLGKQSFLILAGRISGFNNPHSTKPIENFQCSLYTREDQEKFQSGSIMLSSFTASLIDVELTSSSNVIGKKDNQLSIHVTPQTTITEKGLVILKIPEYYAEAGMDYMFSGRIIDDCLNSLGGITRCEFSPRNMQLELEYFFTSGKDMSEEVIFTVPTFNNPVVNEMEGFELEILDDEEYLISKTLFDITISGIDQNAVFEKYDFNYVDYSNSGQYAVHQLTLMSSIPIQKGCNVRIVFPSDFTVDENLVSIVGTGFFEPVTGVLDFVNKPGTNIVEIQACKKNFGTRTDGNLQLSRILNQLYVHTFENSFEVYMTTLDDKNFERPYQLIDKTWIINIDQQRPGLMKGQVEASNMLVQSSTVLRFSLEFSLDHDYTAYMQIDMPRNLEFQGPSCNIPEMKGFSDMISCTRQGHLITINNLFDYQFLAENYGYLELTIEEFLTPMSVRDIGNIQIITYDYKLGIVRPIDILDINTLRTESGAIKKVEEVNVGTDVTSLTDQEYTFSFQVDHAVPLGGYFSILLSEDVANGVTVSDPVTVKNNCYLVTGATQKGVGCVSGRTEEEQRHFVNITCDKNGFGSEGVGKNASLKFKIKGLTNPRMKNKLSYFKIYTMDSQFRYIDQNFDDEKFFVQMTKILPITSVTVENTNKTNGAQSRYIITIVPSTLIVNDDIFSITFPKEIKLPSKLICDTDYYQMILDLECQRLEESTVQFKLTDVDNTLLKQEVEFNLIIENVFNAASMRPTSQFSKMVFIDSASGLELTEYDQKVLTIANEELGQIIRETALVRQSSYLPQENATVTLQFDTNNELPMNASIIVLVPLKIPEVYKEISECYIVLNNIRVNKVCYFIGRQILFKRFIYDLYKDEGPGFKFIGTIELNFKIKNPDDNENIKKNAYQISIYDDENIKYGIDELKDYLMPMLGCEYPCRECLPSDPYHCTACLPSKNAPQFLYWGVDAERQTCVDFCPAAKGYTSNGSREPRQCKKCADTCLTCAQNDEPGDIDVCVTCKPEFPYLWINRTSCHSQMCPEGSYQSNTLKCMSCNTPCKFCSGPLTCTDCFADKLLKYLYQGNCFDQCIDGYTPIDNKCVKCNQPCATCDFGQVNACLSCDNTGTKQFLYGSQCIEQCPINTTTYFQLKKCLACNVGCALCDDLNTDICLKCSEGLALLDNVCMEECPFEYLKSDDGSVCELRTYPLDRTFIVFPILGTAGFFVLITLASYYLTGRRSLVSSTLIAIFGPIEMAACFYQFLYSASEDRNYLPILIGSICVFSSGIIINTIFVVTFIKQTRGKDKEFERWTRKHKYGANCFLFLSVFVSMTLYRLIFCRVFRTQVTNAKMNKPWPFLQHIFIFTWIRFAAFNVPLIIVDLVGLSHLDWGNQCFMTMLESMLISLMSLGLMIWEYKHKHQLILREGQQLNLDKMELLQAQDFSGNFDGDFYGATPNMDRGALMNKLNLDFERDRNLPATPRTLANRVEILQNVLATVKGNVDMELNNDLDTVLKIRPSKKGESLKRANSMRNMRSKTHNQLLDDEFEKSIADSFPNRLDDNEEVERLKAIHDFIQEYKQEIADRNNKGDQYEDPVDNNVIAEVGEPEPEVVQVEMEVQTEQEKGYKDEQEKALDLKRKQMRDSVIEDILNRKREEQRNIRKSKKIRRGLGRRSFYDIPIIEEDDKDSEKSDKVANKKIATVEDFKNEDVFTLAMQIEKGKSLTALWDLNQSEHERVQTLVDRIAPYEYNTGIINQSGIFELSNTQGHIDENLMLPPLDAKGIELSRVSGDLDFSEDDVNLDNDSEAKRQAEKVKFENVQAWIKDQTSDAVHQRNFNENDILGNFERDWKGQIIDRDNVLRAARFVDKDGNVVNERGFLVDESTGDIRSKYTFEVIFKEFNLIGIDGYPNVELPLPLRHERFNFNPHEIMGNFDYDDNDKPQILKDKNGNRIDKNLRKVNKAGWLVDADGNVIDNLGKIRIIKAQLGDKEDIRELYNYDAKKYKIKNIIGTFERHPRSKDIVFNTMDQKNQKQTPKNNKHYSYDMRGRRVNIKGYLLDERGNIIDKSGSIIWRSHELMYNEPPKIFPYSEFSMNWIKGNMDRDVTKNPKHDDEFDLDGHRINTMGYLIDDKENVVDVFRGAIMFKKDILEDKYGQESEIPYIFRSGKLLQPQMDEIEKELVNKLEASLKKGRKVLDSDIDYEDMQEIGKLPFYPGQKREYGLMGNGQLAPMRDRFGREIEEISQDSEQRQMLGDPDMEQDYSKILDDREHYYTQQQPEKQTSKKKKGGMMQSALSMLGGRPQTGQSPSKNQSGVRAHKVNPGDGRAQSAFRNERPSPMKDEPIPIRSNNLFPTNN